MLAATAAHHADTFTGCSFVRLRACRLRRAVRAACAHRGRRRDGHDVDHVLDRAARERSCTGRARPCKSGPEGPRAGQPLGQLVGDVTGIEVGKDENIRATLEAAVGGTVRLPCRDLRHQRGVSPAVRPRKRSRPPASENRPAASATFSTPGGGHCHGSRTRARRPAAPRREAAGSSPPPPRRCSASSSALGSGSRHSRSRRASVRREGSSENRRRRGRLRPGDRRRRAPRAALRRSSPRLP